jgi:energy-coupling factor transporter ATP-binding protein EcfA2
LTPTVATRLTAALEDLVLEEQHQTENDDEPLLLVLLLGGSGTGKSTLFNALAGERLAPVTIQRPTTTAPIAYVHEAIPASRLAAYPPLQQMRVVHHSRPGLRQKILIDTPDFDTHQAVLEHRQLVCELLPWCDLVLFVVSPEKYVDQASWQMLLAQVPHRAFAFVFTKADTLYDDGGMLPHRDLLNKVQALGYARPRLYRVTAEQWVQFRTGERHERPQDDDFLALEHWLEDELQGDDVAELQTALRWRKVERLRQALIAARPAALDALLPQLQQAWGQHLSDAVEAFDTAAQAPVGTVLTRLQMEMVMEQHRQFRGLLGAYFSLADLIRYGPTLLLQTLRQEPGGVSYVQERLREVWDAPGGRETWRQLHRRLRHAAGEYLVDQAGTNALHWLTRRLIPLEDAGPGCLSQALPTILAELRHPPVATHPLLRVGQRVLKGLFELLPVLFVLLCGSQLVVSFWHGQYLGGAFLLHAGALLVCLCLALHAGVGLVFPVTWRRRQRRFRRLFSEQLWRFLSWRYMAVLDDLAAATQKEQQAIDRLCARLQPFRQTRTLPERTSLQGVFVPSPGGTS